MIRIKKYSGEPLKDLIRRETAANDAGKAAEDIIRDVRERGDEALRDYALRFNQARIESLEVSRDEIVFAREMLSREDPRSIEVLNKAACRIREFHTMELRKGFQIERDGVRLGMKILPIEKAGVYVPSGEAPLSSSVLMCVIPARIAGVSEVILTSAPREDGSIDPYILTAADIAGADRIFKCGGAQAIAAMSFGTETVPKVDKVVGPGSAYVAEAKRRVYGTVGIDMIAGPSEILIISDGKNDPGVVAADMIAQAEHDSDAAAMLITDSEELALKVRDKIEERLKTLPRESVARASIDSRGLIFIVSDITEAVKMANAIAPEHLELMADEPFKLLDKVSAAGSVFLGRFSPEALGDYLAGPNHTLPTGGAARFASPLGVDDFMKKTQYIYYTEEALKQEAPDIAYFAGMEGLKGHAESALSRFPVADED